MVTSSKPNARSAAQLLSARLLGGHIALGPEGQSVSRVRPNSTHRQAGRPGCGPGFSEELQFLNGLEQDLAI